MSATKIQATEHPVGDIFSDDFRFTIPRQPATVRLDERAGGEMFDDLLAAATEKASIDDVDPYFLGSVVLVKDEADPGAEVVDGQQRLTTLTILLSCLRETSLKKIAESLEARMFQKGDAIKETIDQPRLTLRDRDHGFFEKHIQERSGITTIGSLSTDALSDSQRNMVENAVLFLERLADLDVVACDRLTKYVSSHTYLVVVSTQDFESAYRIFTVLNERGPTSHIPTSSSPR